MLDPVLQRRLQTVFLFIGACCLGAYLINLVATSGLFVFGLTLGAGVVGLWILTAGPRWWLPLPAAITFGGLFYFGFKIYLHEMALPLCLLALVPAVGFHRVGHGLRRDPVPLSAWLLFYYFLVEWIVSLYLLKAERLGGTGSMSRIYFQGIWPLVFLILFRSFGETRHLKTALKLIYVACLLRIAVTFVAFFNTELFFLPYLNFVFSSSRGGIIDFRYSGLQILLLSLCFAHISRVKFFKFLHLLVSIGAASLIFLGGGRVSVGMLFTIPLFWTLFFRRLALLSVASVILLGGLLYLNKQPRVIYLFPPTAQRALSVLVLNSPTSDLDWHENLRGSNEWHRRLAELGLEKWTRSGLTVFFGDRARPFDENFTALEASVEMRAQVAASMGLYESGLWTILGLTGVGGLILYVLVFRFLLKDVFRSILAEGMKTHAHVVGFIAIAGITLWACFAWIAGGFPSQELMMAILARYAWEDGRLATAARPALDAPS